MKTDKALGLQKQGLILENKVSLNSNLTKNVNKTSYSIHKILLFFYPLVRNSTTQLTILCTVRRAPVGSLAIDLLLCSISSKSLTQNEKKKRFCKNQGTDLRFLFSFLCYVQFKSLEGANSKGITRHVQEAILALLKNSPF